MEVMRQLPGPGECKFQNFVLRQFVHHDCMVAVANQFADTKQGIVAFLDGQGEHLLLDLPDRCGEVGLASGSTGEGEGWHYSIGRNFIVLEQRRVGFPHFGFCKSILLDFFKRKQAVVYHLRRFGVEPLLDFKAVCASVAVYRRQ